MLVPVKRMGWIKGEKDLYDRLLPHIDLATNIAFLRKQRPKLGLIIRTVLELANISLVFEGGEGSYVCRLQ